MMNHKKKKRLQIKVEKERNEQRIYLPQPDTAQTRLLIYDGEER